MAFADRRDFLVGVALDLLALEEKIGPQFIPLLGFVERDDGVDHLEGKLVQLAVHRRAGGHPVAVLDELLALRREHEVGEQQRGVRVRRTRHHANGVGPAEGGVQRLPLYRRTL